MKAIVTCDIIKSRKYTSQQRKELNTVIKDSFEECCLLIPEAEADRFSFSIVQGDEFQILIHNPAYACRFTFFFRLTLNLAPLQASFRAGIGIGEVLNADEHLYRMDGSAFHYSRDAMNLFKKTAYSDRITTLKADDEVLEANIDLILGYNDFLEQRCSSKQKEAICLHEKHGSFKVAAQNSGVSLQALHQRVNASGFKQIAAGNDKLCELIKQLSSLTETSTSI